MWITTNVFCILKVFVDGKPPATGWTGFNCFAFFPRTFDTSPSVAIQKMASQYVRNESTFALRWNLWDLLQRYVGEGSADVECEDLKENKNFYWTPYMYI